MGMDADTVSPAFKAKYTVAAPNNTPKIVPRKIDFHVNSGMMVDDGI